MILNFSNINDKFYVRLREIRNFVYGIFLKHEYKSYCTICGNNTVFLQKDTNLRETFVSKICKSCSRNRYLYKILT